MKASVRLFLLVVGLFVGCAPEALDEATLISGTTTSLTTPIPTPSMTSVVESATSTALPTPEYTPTPTIGPTPTSPPDAATATSIAATVTTAMVMTQTMYDVLTAEAQANPTVPTATPLTPQPTFTPFPDVTWSFFFSGWPCPETIVDDCHDSRSLPPELAEQKGYYFLDTNGHNLQNSQLTNGLFSSFYNIAVSRIRFAPSSEQIAFEADCCIYMTDVNGSEPISVYTSAEQPVRGFDFWDQSNCLVMYKQQPEIPFASVTLEKVCRDNPSPEVITAIEFTNLSPIAFYHLSSDGDYLLAYSYTGDGGLNMYVQPIGNSEPATLVFSQSSSPGIQAHVIALRWLTDNATIEFLLAGVPYTFYTVSADGTNLQAQMTLSGFSVLSGDWSPDGLEFVFSDYSYEHDPGIYILNLNTGNWRFILPEFFVPAIHVWKADLLTD